jgi:Transcriptional regulators
MTSDLGSIVACWRRERPDLCAETIELAAMLKRIADRLEAETRRVSQTEIAMGPGDMRVLLALRRNGRDLPMRPTDLFRSLLISSGAVSKQVHRLQSEGYVERLPDPANRGGQLVRLTDRGFAATNALMDGLFAPDSRVSSAIGALDPGQRAQAIALMQRIAGALEALDDPDPPEA